MHEVYHATHDLSQLIRTLASGTIFSCRFTTRQGDERRMVCRLGVRKGVTGRGQRFDPADKGLIVVYDMQRRGWRSIPVEGIATLRIRRTLYTSGGAR